MGNSTSQQTYGLMFLSLPELSFELELPLLGSLAFGDITRYT